MNLRILAVCPVAALLSFAALAGDLARDFESPPPESRPWVYWYFNDGHLSRDGMTADLEAMKAAGIGGGIFLEVNLGLPTGPVPYMSGPWQDLLKHAKSEAERLGLQLAFGAGPGWCGTGGPWVAPEHAMQHLVASETNVTGPAKFEAPLPRPQPRKPFFGEGTLTPELREAWQSFYRDEAVIAFPTPAGGYRILEVDEKALFHRAPFSSAKNVKPFLTPDTTVLPPGQAIPSDRVVELTAKLAPDGRLVWDVPAGNWTIVRLGRTLTGQTTRPAPKPGLGFESGKFERASLDAHFTNFFERLMQTAGPIKGDGTGLTTLHFDSWEMSSQNWSETFRAEFKRRRGYDPVRFAPAMFGRAVDSVEISERFLWDLRRTAQELVVANHLEYLRELGRRHGLLLSCEPYDMNPAGDLTLAACADVPMAEFWSKGYGFATEYSAVQAVSIAHTGGRNVIGAEAFTSHQDAWRQHPGSMKDQGDWALCAGINRIVFHRFQHQPQEGRLPGMTFGPYGVHWDRTQTWWEFAPAYHTYLSRCQTMLRQGLPVADILYLDGEGAPRVFLAPPSALQDGFPDRRGYNFDACAPDTLLARASVRDGRIVFPDGMSYRVLVLPRSETMSLPLLKKIGELARAGATIVGAPPKRTPGLERYPDCDLEIRKLAAGVWERVRLPRSAQSRTVADISSAQWIWHREGNPAASAPVARRWFTREIVLPGPVAEAEVAITADNSFDLSINGTSVATGDNFHEVVRRGCGALLKPGTNRVAVLVDNGGDTPNPAGLLASLAILFVDGRTTSLVTDAQWTSGLAADRVDAPVQVLGSWNMAPWKLVLSKPAQGLYPPYDETAALLAGLNVPPDFESDADLRYTHRHDDEAEIYFVGNRTKTSVTASCTFRVTGLRPELWDPMTGTRRVLPEFREANGRTTVPLRFEPLQSWYIVFRKAGDGVTDPARRNFPDLKPVAEIPGPWQVDFFPMVGKSTSAVFQSLENWADRAEPDIKYCSGRATYRRSFDFAGAPGVYRLDLGTVHNFARVQLNGRDLGTLWCAPWQVEIPTNLLKTTGNELTVTVANLWPNRLIRDAGLPEAERLSRATWSPYKPGDPLLPSGLLGPVRILGVSTDLPDLRTVPADLTVPPLGSGAPAAGVRVKQSLPAYAGTEVYHVLYLPTDWRPGAKYPVIVEYAGNGGYSNKYGDVSLGVPEGSKLGYGISGGSNFIWICVPYVEVGRTNIARRWWGDIDATLDYCNQALRMVCTEYGGDASNVVLTGFSRGSIACTYLGLRNDEIAKLWRAFIPFSHYDGVGNFPYADGDAASAIARLKRIAGRPSFICHEGSVEKTRQFIEASGVRAPFTFQSVPFRNHNDEWILRDSPARQALRTWLRDALQVPGRVTASAAGRTGPARWSGSGS